MTGSERTPRDASSRDGAPAAGGWLVVTASELGAAHRARGQGLQDAVAVRYLDDGAVAVAVADGHGDRRHFRSAKGAALAVELGCQVAAELAAGLAAGPESRASARQIEEEARATLVPAVIGRWRAAVRVDLAAAPFSPAEEAARAAGDDDLIAYGSTLLVALVTGDWLVLAQIGDGDVVGVGADGAAHLPVPVDPVLDGQSTTSLCGVRPEADFRVRAVDLTATPLIALLVATDGYGNAQAADRWAGPVSADLAEMLGEHPPDWFAGQLPRWVQACASADGSADDATVALLIAPDATQRRWQAAAALPAEPPTRRLRFPAVAAPRHAPAAAAARAAAQATGRSAGRSRRVMALAAACAVVVTLVALAGVHFLTASPAARQRATRHPAATLPAATSPAAIRPSTIQPSAAQPSAAQPSHPQRPGTGAGPQPGSSAAGQALPSGPKLVVRGPGFAIVLVNGQLWWCRSARPTPSGCTLIANLMPFGIG